MTPPALPEPSSRPTLTKAIVGHIASEHSIDASPVPTHNQALSRQQAYPALRHLDVSGLRPANNQTKVFRDLFSVLPSITLLVAQAILIAVLGDYPRLLPHLEGIRLIGKPPKGLCRRVLHHRAEAGYPVKTFEIGQEFLSSVDDDRDDDVYVCDPDDDYEPKIISQYMQVSIYDDGGY
ncbi:hypothetical protein FRC12_021478 [Ceratobasidium sp. 428]|nr:hypothetical protein FRC12_021478 [Ceratobasidium sp. 428]